ncbi:hypothetical protein GCM10009747_34920 [Agromyces humatus]|uniref:Uncharacterized protein n=1 Tax=Agromyces humatus TaxID=279573 RepID=A0ABP4X8P1_9MICO
MTREEEDGVARRGAEDVSCDVQAISLGHVEVEYRDIGTMTFECGHGFCSGAGFSDYADVSFKRKEGRKSGADETLIVGEEHGDGHDSPLSKLTESVNVSSA